MTLDELRARGSVPNAPALAPERSAQLLALLSGWAMADGEICKDFEFENYYQTMAFVNAVAYVAHREDHHPDMEVGYNRCRVRYSTHSAGGVTENDFVCAAKVEALVG
ncbi:MAG TPA: 4a-hydroxytetrahydrobiopterin dehydratase [Humisphaera sp.]